MDMVYAPQMDHTLPDMKFQNQKYGFKCEQCDQSFRHYSSLQSHQILHATGTLFKCRMCRMDHANHKSLMNHMRTEHPTRKSRHNQSNFIHSYDLRIRKIWKYNQLGVLGCYIKDFLPPGTYACKLCKRMFARKCDVRKHASWHRTNSSLSLTGIGCVSWDDFVSKKPEEKPYRKYYKCLNCSEVFERYTDFAAHWLEENPYICLFCWSDLESATRLHTHIREHTQITPLRCKRCYKHFPDFDSLSLHINSHLSERPYFCGICSASFFSAENVKTHMEEHIDTTDVIQEGVSLSKELSESKMTEIFY